MTDNPNDDHGDGCEDRDHDDENSKVVYEISASNDITGDLFELGKRLDKLFDDAEIAYLERKYGLDI